MSATTPNSSLLLAKPIPICYNRNIPQKGDLSMDELIAVEAYLNGLTHLASACSSWIGCSEISAICAPPDGIAEELAQTFQLSPEETALTPVPQSLSQLFAMWLGGKEEKLREDLLWLIEGQVGSPVQVLRLQKEEELRGRLGWGEGGGGRYYFLDDLIVVRFAECAVCFYMGNNE